jgi:hypothetical protein
MLGAAIEWRRLRRADGSNFRIRVGEAVYISEEERVVVHVLGGLYFERMPGGGVRVLKRKIDRVDSPALCDVTLDADTWSAVVEAMADERHTPVALLEPTPKPRPTSRLPTSHRPTPTLPTDRLTAR